MNERFQMVVGDVYTLAMGITVTGYIDSGTVRLGDRLVLIHHEERRPVRVTAIQRFRESLTEATVGANPVGISLSGIDRDQVGNRDLLVSDPLLPNDDA
jgi:translation elongation factor EF-Tu-like GTPase